MRVFAVMILCWGAMVLRAAQPLAVIPFVMQDGNIYIKVKVNDSRPLDFAFDTGTYNTVINARTAEQIGLKVGNPIFLNGVTGRVAAEKIRGNRLESGKLLLSGVDLVKLPLAHIEKGQRKSLEGIIGGEILENYLVKIDFLAGRLEIHNADSRFYKGNQKAIQIKAFWGTMPLLEVVLTPLAGGKITATLGLDTGFGGTLMLNSQFAQKHNLVARTGAMIQRRYTGISGTVGRCFLGRMAGLDVAGFRMNRVPVILNEEAQGMPVGKMDGIIGNRVMQHFVLVLDYGARKVYLELNPGLKHSF